MNHKVIIKQVQTSSASFADVTLHFEIRSAPCLTHPPSGRHSSVFFCLSLEEFTGKKRKLFFQELFHLLETGGPEFVCISSFDSSHLQNSSCLWHFFLFPHLCFLFLFLFHTFLWQYLWLFPLGTILPFLLISLTPLYCCSSLPC